MPNYDSVLKAHSPEELYRKDFAAKSKRFRGREREVQKRVYQKMLHTSEKISGEARSLTAPYEELSELKTKLSRLRRNNNKKSFSKLFEEYEKKYKNFKQKLNTQKQNIKQVELLGKRIFIRFEPTNLGGYKKLQLERKLHVVYKTLLEMEHYARLDWMDMIN